MVPLISHRSRAAIRCLLCFPLNWTQPRYSQAMVKDPPFRLPLNSPCQHYAVTMPTPSGNSTPSRVSAVSALKIIARYLPHNETTQNLGIIQREAHSLALLYHGRARTIVHTARTLIFAFKLGVDWLQVWWAQTKKLTISPFSTPLVDGGKRTNNDFQGPEIGVLSTPASLARLPTVQLDDISIPSYSSRPRPTTATTTTHALEIYQPASSTEPSFCCSRSQLITLFSICLIALVLIITASSTPRKPKPNLTSPTAHPVRAQTDEKSEHPAKPSSPTTQSPDSDTEDTDGGGTRLPGPTEDVPVPVPRNRPVHAHHEVGDAAAPFSSKLRGGRRNVSVHWHRERTREARREESCEKRKRMADGDWRVRGGD